MSGPVVSQTTLYSQPKDGFLWGFRGGTYSSFTTQMWKEVASSDYIYPFDTSSTVIVGRKHSKFKNTNPPEVWERLRGYLSFYTSGFRTGAYVQDAKLRLYCEECLGIYSSTDITDKSRRDWILTVWSISGGTEAIQRTYVAGENPGNYGFGDGILHYDDDAGRDVANWDAWGIYDYPENTSHSTLEAFVASSMFSHMSAQAGITPLDYANDGKTITKFSGWIEIPIPLDALNDLGETHFRLQHFREHLNVTPETGPSGAYNDHEYISFRAYEGANKAQLVISYVDPATFSINDLRLCDLSLQRHLQIGLDRDVTFSGVRVLDGFPDTFQEFDKSRNISLEHVSSTIEDVEIGSKLEDQNRKFFIDIVCDQRGEMLDLQEKIQSILHNYAYMKDFRYGFANPPNVAKMNFENIRIFEMPLVVTPDRNRFHSVVSVDVHAVRS